MTAEPQMTDRALDAALAKSRDPMVPADLARRVTAQATAQPQRRIGRPFLARRTRRKPRKSRARRPVLFGAIGGGLLAASAVAAALVSDGTFQLARITKPVVELFVPESPRETVTAPVVPAAPARPAVEVDTDAPAAVRGVTAPRPGWRMRQLRRAIIVRQRLERVREARIAETRPPERTIPRRAVAAVRIPGAGTLNAQQRARARARIDSLTPEQRQRVDQLRERRAAAPPAIRERIADRRRDRIGERLAERGVDGPAQRPASASPAALARPVEIQSSRGVPTVSDSPVPANASRSMIIDNTSPGPEPAQLDQIRPELPTAETPAAAGARRTAIQERIRAARAAQRVRAAQRRSGPQRPARPRVPPRRR